jgi:hypothetical protein
VVHSVTCENDAKPRIHSTQAVGPDVHLVAARLTFHLESLPSNFAGMDPDAVLEIAHYLIEHRDRRTQAAMGEESSPIGAQSTSQL